MSTWTHLLESSNKEEGLRKQLEHGQRLDILAKPYKHGDLLERVEAALGREV